MFCCWITNIVSAWSLFFFIALVIELKLALLLPKTWSFLDRWRTSASVLVLSEQGAGRRRRRVRRSLVLLAGSRRAGARSGARQLLRSQTRCLNCQIKRPRTQRSQLGSRQPAERHGVCKYRSSLGRTPEPCLQLAAWRGVFSQLRCAKLAAFPKSVLWCVLGRAVHLPAGEIPIQTSLWQRALWK